MTREQAINYMRNSGWSEEQIDTIVAALTSEDAISRRAAIDAMYSLCDGGTLKENEWRDNPHIDSIVNALNELQPVTVQEQTGHWILTVEDWNKWTCSECGFTKRTDVHVTIGYKYCPNCGCRMVEPQESEE